MKNENDDLPLWMRVAIIIAAILVAALVSVFGFCGCGRSKPPMNAEEKTLEHYGVKP